MVERSQGSGLWPAVYEPLRRAGERIADWFAPKSDAAAASEGYSISLELPGVSGEDIDISLHEGTLIVRGEKRSESEERGLTYFFSEREYGTFMRSFRLPPDANPDGIDAQLKNGVLTITVTKLAPNAGPSRKVPIRVE